MATSVVYDVIIIADSTDQQTSSFDFNIRVLAGLELDIKLMLRVTHASGIRRWFGASGEFGSLDNSQAWLPHSLLPGSRLFVL